MNLETNLGATYLGGGRCQFRVWAPFAQRVEAHLVGPQERSIPLRKESRGYHRTVAEGVEPGTLYFYRLDGREEWPDPASGFQPQDVHGPSQVVDHRFQWDDDSWSGLALHHYVIYEIHVGTFTTQGTFDAVIPYLDDLKELGVTAVELMPVAQFPGSRNWGYDGAYPFAVQGSYGGPDGLKRLVKACHQRRLAVVLDVVYNHMGPEGNHLADFGPYFTERYRTPWGAALNFDGPDSDEVRRFFVENALRWVTEFHIDALRLDALHAILDHSPRPFIEELAASVHERAEQLNRRIHLIGESADNNARLIRPTELGGYGLDALWNDDFHHSLHVLLTGEATGYYQDFGQIGHLVRAFREGFVYSGQYSPYRRFRHGSSSRGIPPYRFVVFAQNHDQVGNRLGGERLSQLVSFEALKLAAGIVFLSPSIPLLFMGEEYGEKAPFPYFISHLDPELVEAVRRGRKQEFAAFDWPGEPPDPQDEATFLSARLDHGLRHNGQHRVLRELCRELIGLRCEHPALSPLSKDLEALGYQRTKVLFLRRWSEEEEALALFNFNDVAVSCELPVPTGRWSKELDSAEERWNGPGSPLPAKLASDGEASLSLPAHAFVLFVSRKEP